MATPEMVSYFAEQLAAQVSRGVRHGLPSDQTKHGWATSRGQLASQEDIFGRGESANQGQVLINRLDAKPLGFSRRRKRDWPAVEFPAELPGRAYATPSLALAVGPGAEGQAVVVDRQVTEVPAKPHSRKHVFILPARQGAPRA